MLKKMSGHYQSGGRVDASVSPMTPVRRAMKQLGRLLPLAFLMLLIAVPARAETPPELHVLIDVSGSMKHTDPKNLRRPALKLLGDLLPPQANIGIWFFGNRISPVLSPRLADDQAKAAVRGSANRIRSDEPYTDIPAALETASSQWLPDTDRNILLLSDGMVDISKDKEINERARERLLNDIVPALKKAHVRVHTIALSKDADAKLLSTIAAETGGIFVQADSADALQRAFLKIFEAAAPRDGLPLKDNTFEVDKSVKELTILAFRDDDQKPTQLKLPNGTLVTAALANNLKGWRWDPTGGRDLVTIENPPPGQWQIIGAKDPDNRALIVTDLNLSVMRLPTRVYPGERIDGAISLTNHGDVIRKTDFTSAVQAKIADLNSEGKTMQSIALNDQGADPDVLGGDGYFSFDLKRDYPAGVYSIVATAKSPTFERVWRQNFAMAPTAPIKLEPYVEMPKLAAMGKVPTGESAANTASETHKPEPTAKRWLDITQDPTVIAPGTAELIGAWHCGDAQAGNKPQSVDIKLTQTVERIAVPTPITNACRFEGTLRAKLGTGRNMVLIVKPVNVAAIKPKSAKPVHHEPEAEQAHSSTTQWLLLGSVNGLLLILVGGGFLLWRRSARKTHEKLIEEATR